MPIMAQGLPLEVVNATSQAFVQEPVTFGIPVPKMAGGSITNFDASHITVRDAGGAVVPYQHRVLSRWDGVRSDTSKSVKWVQVTFCADVSANSTATYFLSFGPRAIGGLSVQTFADRYVITPKPGTDITISRQSPTLFQEVTVNGQTVVPSPGGGIRMTDRFGQNVTATVQSTYFQELGTIRAVIVQRGMLSNGLKFTTRYHFHTGRSEVQVDFRLENAQRYGVFYGAPSHQVYFDHCHLWVPVAGAGSTVTTSSGTYGASGTGFEINQDFAWGSDPTDALGSFFFEERAGSTVVSSGNRADGAMDLTGGGGGVTASVDRFWQNFPKALRVTNDELEIGLWPEWGHGPEYRGVWATLNSSTPIDPYALDNYRFEGGRWKSHRVVFDFHAGNRTPTEVAQLAERTNRPIMGRTSGEWVAQTAATGKFFASKRTWNDIGLDRLERQFEMLWDDNAADFQGSGLGKIGFRKFRQRGGTYGGRQFYGWESFGDIVWGEGYGGIHYDWPYHFLMAWVRGGSYEQYDVARDMVAHRRDYDQNHSNDPAESWRGCQFYEKGWWHGNYVNGQSSHNWVHGLLLHYATTGDEASYEAALQAQGYLLRNSPANWSGYWGSRIAGWAIVGLVDLYNYLGDPAALAEAQGGVQNFLNLEQASGGLGYVGNPGAGMQAVPWMHAVCFHGIARYSMISQDFTYVPLLQRMRDFIQSHIQIPGGSPAPQMGMPYMTAVHHPAQGGNAAWNEGTNAHHLWYAADTMAISAMIWRQQSDVNSAWFLYQMLARFHQKGSGQWCDFDDPNDFSPIAMRMMMYPNSESKIMAGILGSAPTYMAMTAWLDGTLYQTN